jgi:hypothetical protein
MGYTHYYTQTRDFTAKEWSAIQLNTLAIEKYCREKHEIELRDSRGSNKPTRYAFDILSFNGIKKLSCEDFVLLRWPEDYLSSMPPVDLYCKTARKPYDLAVCLTLLRVLAIAPDAIKISSDGCWDNEDEWVPARKAYVELFEEEPICFDPSFVPPLPPKKAPPVVLLPPTFRRLRRRGAP